MNIEEIRKSIVDGITIEYTMHCQKRMLERGISRADIRKAIFNGEIIEEYSLSDDNTSEKSLPSCLILGKCIDDIPIHIVIGYNSKKVIMISACYPDRDHWNEDNKTRRN